MTLALAETKIAALIARHHIRTTTAPEAAMIKTYAETTKQATKETEIQAQDTLDEAAKTKATKNPLRLAPEAVMTLQPTTHRKNIAVEAIRDTMTNKEEATMNAEAMEEATNDEVAASAIMIAATTILPMIHELGTQGDRRATVNPAQTRLDAMHAPTNQPHRCLILRPPSARTGSQPTFLGSTHHQR